MDHAGRLAPAGLVFLELLDLKLPLVPPALANLATGYQQRAGQCSVATVERTEPDFLTKANDSWFELCRAGGLIGDDGEFLVAVPLDEDGRDLWWARVRLAESWDLVGEGSVTALGLGFGSPEFTTLSVKGDVAAFCASHELAVITVVAAGFSSLPDLRKHAEWVASQQRISEQEKAAAGRWLEASGD
ncbi:hypothetical protein [Streptomyces showdoensis]|uniref:Uncharacterized protein n=1 Tax=Streptomyces showdoensis TaxID=68268 RepID=A0A2P2GG90_STREW|nr:hypothetical protein [Streptomyces showdoensis]KKZ70523.1 hypothetical protein VO63_28340 [Streptomyces showdoensis]